MFEVAGCGGFNWKKETWASFRILASSSSPDGQGSLTQDDPNEHYYVCILLRHQANSIEMFTLGEGIQLRLLVRHSLARSGLVGAYFSCESGSLRPGFSQKQLLKRGRYICIMNVICTLHLCFLLSSVLCHLRHWFCMMVTRHINPFVNQREKRATKQLPVLWNFAIRPRTKERSKLNEKTGHIYVSVCGGEGGLKNCALETKIYFS
jgi:hypothetical protein